MPSKSARCGRRAHALARVARLPPLPVHTCPLLLDPVVLSYPVKSLEPSMMARQSRTPSTHGVFDFLFSISQGPNLFRQFGGCLAEFLLFGPIVRRVSLTRNECRNSGGGHLSLR